MISNSAESTVGSSPSWMTQNPGSLTTAPGVCLFDAQDTYEGPSAPGPLVDPIERLERAKDILVPPLKQAQETIEALWKGKHSVGVTPVMLRLFALYFSGRLHDLGDGSMDSLGYRNLVLSLVPFDSGKTSVVATAKIFDAFNDIQVADVSLEDHLRRHRSSYERLLDHDTSQELTELLQVPSGLLEVAEAFLGQHPGVVDQLNALMNSEAMRDVEEGFDDTKRKIARATDSFEKIEGRHGWFKFLSQVPSEEARSYLIEQMGYDEEVLQTGERPERMSDEVWAAHESYLREQSSLKRHRFVTRLVSVGVFAAVGILTGGMAWWVAPVVGAGLGLRSAYRDLSGELKQKDITDTLSLMNQTEETVSWADRDDQAQQNRYVVYSALSTPVDVFVGMMVSGASSHMKAASYEMSSGQFMTRRFLLSSSGRVTKTVLDFRNWEGGDLTGEIGDTLLWGAIGFGVGEAASGLEATVGTKSWEPVHFGDPSQPPVSVMDTRIRWIDPKKYGVLTLMGGRRVWFAWDESLSMYEVVSTNI